MGDRGDPSQGREFDLDPFRGLVCLWLMGLHLCYMSEAHPALLRLVGPAAAETLYHARLGVESFLVLAGFMMAHMLRPVPGQDVRAASYLARRGCPRSLWGPGSRGRTFWTRSGTSAGGPTASTWSMPWSACAC